MTIPTMTNCPHSGDGWCLKCVHKLQKQCDKHRERANKWEPRMRMRGGEVTVILAKGYLCQLVDSFGAMFDEYPDCNYLEHSIKSGGDFAKEFKVTLQRPGKPTPHELRKKAEAEVIELRKQLESANVKF